MRIAPPSFSSFKPVLAFAIGIAATCSPMLGAPPHHSALAAIVLDNFGTWDANSDGTLTQPEIEKIVTDPAVKGDQAAAAATLEMVARSKKVIPPVMTKAYFEQWAAKSTGTQISGADAATQTVDIDRSSGTGGGAASTTAPSKSAAPANTAPKWDTLFAASKHRIETAATTNQQLASATDSPMDKPGIEALQHLRQGPLGDCFFVAAVGAQLNRNPSAIKSMISLLPGEKMRVKFDGLPEPIVLPMITDAQRAISSTGGTDGEWLPVLEQAYGRYRNGKSASTTQPAPLEGTDAICHGGSPTSVVRVLTGHSTKYISLPKDAAKRNAEAGKRIPDLRAEFASAMTEHRLVVASIGAEPTPDTKPAEPNDDTNATASATIPSPPNITHGHAYAIVDFDPKTDVLTIWNPHGQKFVPKGPDGIANGYTTTHGIFKIPLSEAYQFYSSFGFETVKAATSSPATTESHLKKN